MQRLLGHWGFCLQFRRIFYSSLFHTFHWIEDAREEDVTPLETAVIDELLVLVLLASQMHTRLDTPVSTIIGATDASGEIGSSGYGGCEARVGKHIAEEIYRISDSKGERVKLGEILSSSKQFTSLTKLSPSFKQTITPAKDPMTPSGTSCPSPSSLQLLPSSSPSGPALHAHVPLDPLGSLTTPSDTDPLSASALASSSMAMLASKVSASSSLTTALQASGVTSFGSSLIDSDNDPCVSEPSLAFVGSLPPTTPSPSSAKSPVPVRTNLPGADLPAVVSSSYIVAIHMFSGRRRIGDFHNCLCKRAAVLGLTIYVEDYDLSVHKRHDLLSTDFFEWLKIRCEKEVRILLGGPPCGTWSAARHLGPPGPPPIRSRTHPWGLPGLTGPQKRQCDDASLLLIRFVALCRIVASNGGSFLLEHPGDRGPPFASIWAVSLITDLLLEFACLIREIDQCMFGGLSRKFTCIAGNALGLARLEGLCNHPPRTHIQLRGKNPDGTFKTAAAQSYPRELCEELSVAFLPSSSAAQPLCVDSSSFPENVGISILPSVSGQAKGSFGPQLSKVPSNEPSPHAWLADILCDWKWKTTFGGKFEPGDCSHINEKELKAARLWARRCARGGPTMRKRHIMLVDSRVAAGAFNKGRSSSFRINRILKTFIPLCVAGQCSFHAVWIPSKANPSDAPSRGKRLWTWIAEAKRDRDVRIKTREAERQKSRRSEYAYPSPSTSRHVSTSGGDDSLSDC